MPLAKTGQVQLPSAADAAVLANPTPAKVREVATTRQAAIALQRTDDEEAKKRALAKTGVDIDDTVDADPLTGAVAAPGSLANPDGEMSGLL